MSPDDEQEKARKERAAALRSEIGKLKTGEKSGGKPSPRETTDEAARKQRDAADKLTSTPKADGVKD